MQYHSIVFLVVTVMAMYMAQIISASDIANVLKKEIADKNEFDSIISKSKKEDGYVLAEFYAPWCPYSQKMHTVLEKVDNHFKTLVEQKDSSSNGRSIDISIIQIDCTSKKGKVIADEYSIVGYPTLVFYYNGKHVYYYGKRDYDSVLHWINKKIGLIGPNNIDTSDSFNQFLKPNNNQTDLAVIGLFNDEASARAFKLASIELDTIPFALVVGEKAIKQVNIGNSGSILLYDKYVEKSPIAFSGDANDAHSIVKFILGSRFPNIVKYSPDTAVQIFQGPIQKHLLLFLDASNEQQTSSILAYAEVIARKYNGEYLFVTIDKKDDRMLQFFEIDVKDLPTSRIITLGEKGMKKYKLIRDEITQESIEESLKSHMAGTLPDDLKSEDIPEKQEGDVFVLVAKQFNEIVKAPGHKNVLLEVYEPDCGHCRRLHPIFEQLAKKYKSYKNLVVAKMDGTKNEVEDLLITGFPAIRLFLSNSDDMVPYAGDRSFEALSKFLEKYIPDLASCESAQAQAQSA